MLVEDAARETHGMGRALAHVHVDDVHPVMPVVGRLSSIEVEEGAEMKVLLRRPFPIAHRTEKANPVEVGGLLHRFGPANFAARAFMPDRVDVADLADPAGGDE